MKNLRFLVLMALLISPQILTLAAGGCLDGTTGDDTLTCSVTPPTTGNNDDQLDGDLGDDIIVLEAGVTIVDIDADGQSAPGDLRGAGNGGNDTITNYGLVTKSIVGDFADGNGGDDTIINYGTVEDDIGGDETQGQGGNDTIINAGTVGDHIYGEGGNDTIIITDHANGGSDHVLDLDGGAGDDTVVFRFSDPATYAKVNAALVGKLPSSGRITINGETFTWAYFEHIRNDDPSSVATPVATAQPTTPLSIVSFTLINADTDLPIEGFNPLPPDATLNLAKLPTTHLNIRADVSDSPIGSIVFSGSAGRRTESLAPYTLRGDTNGDYAAWTPAVGSYTVNASLYSRAGGVGQRLQKVTFSFTVTDEADAP